MIRPVPLLRTRLLALFAAAGGALALPAGLGAATPVALPNLDFEQGEVGQAPPAWMVPEDAAKLGYAATTVGERPEAGARCALLTLTKAAAGLPVGHLVRSLAADPYRGKRVRFSAAVRVEVKNPGQRARLWIGTEGPGRGAKDLGEYLTDPITADGWQRYRIVGEVRPDSTFLNLGLAVVGDAKAWIDSASLEIVGDAGAGNEPAAPLSPRGLDDLVAFARLYGYVRFFHPSDEAAAADWQALALAGVQRAEKAADPQELARVLEAVFHPVAPALRVAPAAAGRPALPDELVAAKAQGANEVLAWEHHGVGNLSPAGSMGNIYTSKRVARPLQGPGLRPEEPLVVDLGGGVTALVPLALFKDGKGTLPHAAAPPRPIAPQKPEDFLPTGDDRATRLADVVVAWNVFQHFYPYFDVVKVDWPEELRKALREAAADRDGAAFLRTLQRLVAALQDGHGNVAGPTLDLAGRFPFFWEVVEGKLAVVAVLPQETSGLRRGDVIRTLGGRPAAEVISEAEALVSGATPQWRRWKAVQGLLSGPRDSVVKAEVVHADGTVASLDLRRSLSAGAEEAAEQPRPDKISELRPGIFYADLNRVTDDDFNAALPRLGEAKGIVFDLRGYPRAISPVVIAHLIDQPVNSAQWHVPKVVHPDHQGMEFDFANWPVEPEAPRFHGKVAFLTDGEAISYAETYLGIIENYKLAAIVGSPTAGTNGNINPFNLPGGYRVVFTGMQVLKHDGSRHHGVGIQPTVPAARTLSGVAAGRDEVLEKGIAVVSP